MVEQTLVNQLEIANECRTYVNKLQKDEQIRAKKRNKLNWGFDSKQRWERKGNM